MKKHGIMTFFFFYSVDEKPKWKWEKILKMKQETLIGDLRVAEITVEQFFIESIILDHTLFNMWISKLYTYVRFLHYNHELAVQFLSAFSVSAFAYN